jgi:AcrR family transcriptional regulator
MSTTAIADKNGRTLGPRALKKRRQFMDATAALLENSRLRDLRVVDIARSIGSSPATFYQYFEDVEDVVLQLADEASEEILGLAQVFNDSWQDEDGIAKAKFVVDAYIRHWDQYGAILRIRNLASDEGDERFYQVRSKAVTPLLNAMALQIEKNANPSLKPIAAAVAMGSILERLSAYHVELEQLGVSREDLVDSSAQILYQTLTNTVIQHSK